MARAFLGRTPSIKFMNAVLVIDNDPAIRELLTMAFEGEKVRVLAASSFVQADSILREEAVGVLLVDLHLGGGVSGATLVDSWAKEGMLCPFFVVTGTPHAPVLKSLEVFSEFQGIVPKPFKLFDLIEKVKQIL